MLNPSFHRMNPRFLRLERGKVLRSSQTSRTANLSPGNHAASRSRADLADPGTEANLPPDSGCIGRDIDETKGSLLIWPAEKQNVVFHMQPHQSVWSNQARRMPSNSVDVFTELSVARLIEFFERFYHRKKLLLVLSVSNLCQPQRKKGDSSTLAGYTSTSITRT